MKTLIEAEIYGQTFTITSEDEEEEVRALAASVDERMRKFGERVNSSPLRIAMMAALSFADEVRKMKKQASVEPPEERRGYH